MFTPPVPVKPELERISAELYSNAWRRPTLSWPQISGQRLISFNHHSSTIPNNLKSSLKRDTPAQEVRETEEEEAEEEAVEETEAAEAAEAEEVDPEVDQEEEEPPSENDNFDIIITNNIFSEILFPAGKLIHWIIWFMILIVYRFI